MSPLPSYLHPITAPTPFPVGPVNLYLAEGDPLTLIDTGPRFGPAREALREGLAALGYRPADLGRILLTHIHGDHCGLAAELAGSSGAEVLTHPANFPQLADYADERERRIAFYSALMQEAGMPPGGIAQIDRVQRGYGRFAEPVRPDGPLEEGMTVRLGGEEWQVLHTPGHTGGLICLYQPQRRLLLSSDHLLRDISSNPIVEPPAREGGERPHRLLDYLAQLERIARLPTEVALPGHGPPITDVPGLVASRLAFHEQRARQVLEALRDGPCTIYQITLALFPELDPINRFLAISEVIGHLDWLQVQGWVESQIEEGVRWWRSV
ncbi:MAG TPA: MBL fold metallo-hydrolase [Anaerolineales bacterium]|nr:MBL fold metallo-hydrolase [Anaerolineae bacterium]HIQ01336.1 MBL fold metallo-hydrolase [Anaerolineales bacterium]